MTKQTLITVTAMCSSNTGTMLKLPIKRSNCADHRFSLPHKDKYDALPYLYSLYHYLTYIGTQEEVYPYKVIVVMPCLRAFCVVSDS